jgi:hypothetical protein
MAEDTYTLKEMIQELRSETKEQSTVLTTVCASLEGIEKHLAQLNSKVATHEMKHNKIEAFMGRATVIISIAVFFAVTLVNEVIAFIKP